MEDNKPAIKPFGAVDTVAGILLVLLMLSVPVLFVVCVRAAVMSDDESAATTRDSGPLPWMP